MKKKTPGFLVHQLQVHARLLFSIAVGVMVAWLIPRDTVDKPVTGILIGWNTSVWLYLALVAVMMTRATPETMRSRAKALDEGKTILLILVILTAVASLVAIVAELLTVKYLEGTDRAIHIALACTTIVASWAFTHTMFALHYAHAFYSPGEEGRDPGLCFPGTKHPDYGDFLYAAAIIGTSGQTADVSFTSQGLRRIGAIHSVLAFFFNTTVLALTINIAASLLGS